LTKRANANGVDAPLSVAKARSAINVLSTQRSVSSFAAVQTLKELDRFGRPHLLCPLIPEPRFLYVAREISDAERI
jgi:hypothetical protein